MSVRDIRARKPAQREEYDLDQTQGVYHSTYWWAGHVRWKRREEVRVVTMVEVASLEEPPPCHAPWELREITD